MTTNPFGSIGNDTLVSQTAVDTDQSHLVFTKEQFDNLDNKVVRRLAAEFSSGEVNGKSPRFQTRAALAVQRTLDEFSE